MKNENIFLFNQIFENVLPLKNKVKNMLSKNAFLAKKTILTEKNSVYEIMSHFSHKKQKIKSLYLIIQENSSIKK